MTPAPPRIATLDFIRGIAVMGILLANLPAFGLPESAYFSPLSWGGSTGIDRVAWYATFVLVEGKMRGLFTLLFGASMLLVADQARRAGRSPAATHYARMAVLFVIGCLHLYLIWWGDILAHYALVGSIAFLFSGLSVRWLVGVGVAMLGWEIAFSAAGGAALFAAGARATPAAIETWNAMAYAFGVPPATHLRAEIAALGGSFVLGVRWRWAMAGDPFTFLPILGPQTLSAMLFGMAAYRSGLLTGAWDGERYRRWALVTLGIALPVYAVLGLVTIAHGFDQRWVYLASIAVVPPFRIAAAIGYACVLVLLFTARGRASERIAAVGRAAFTNYLGTSMLMGAVFAGWGLGLFARLSRAELYLLAPLVWAIMLAWSQPWLVRFRFGPLEWVWRSMARGAVQPLRRADA